LLPAALPEINGSAHTINGSFEDVCDPPGAPRSRRPLRRYSSIRTAPFGRTVYMELSARNLLVANRKQA